MSRYTLKGKAVIVGGGAKNLGGLISRSLAAEGARVCVHFNRAATKVEADQTVADIRAAGGTAFAMQGDFTNIDDVIAVIHAAKEQFNGIDIAVNTVGKVFKKPFLETSEVEYDLMAAINSKATYFFIQQAGKHLNAGGKICTIVNSLLAAYYSTYGGLKAPVEHFTRMASKEFGPRGISVTAVCPSPMNTPFLDTVFFNDQATSKTGAGHKPALAPGGGAKTEDIVALVKFLITDGWWITGQTIFANGS